MKKLARSILGTCAIMLSAAALASPVSLGSIEHLYGTAAGHQLPSAMGVAHRGGNCDSATANGINVKATLSSSCNRFADVFDFSSIDFDSVDHFALTLSFTGARNQNAGLERWNVLGASNYGQSADYFGSKLIGSGTQTFVFDSTASLFDDIVNANNFFFSFKTPGGMLMNFTLNSARFEVFGTPAVVAIAPVLPVVPFLPLLPVSVDSPLLPVSPESPISPVSPVVPNAPAVPEVSEVPEPGSLALMGLSLLALTGVRRLRKAKAV